MNYFKLFFLLGIPLLTQPLFQRDDVLAVRQGNSVVVSALRTNSGALVKPLQVILQALKISGFVTINVDATELSCVLQDFRSTHFDFDVEIRKPVRPVSDEFCQQKFVEILSQDQNIVCTRSLSKRADKFLVVPRKHYTNFYDLDAQAFSRIVQGGMTEAQRQGYQKYTMGFNLPGDIPHFHLHVQKTK